MEYVHVTHEFPPLYDENSEILILGSIPSPKSRAQAFYYGHPQNRFWKVLAAVLEEPVPETIEDKKKFLHRNHIAVWDVIASCTISGSSDASIRDVVPNPIERILEEADIRQIFVNGKTAGKMFVKYQQEKLGRDAIVLPSTSPANAAWTLDKLLDAWGEALCCRKND